VTRAVVIALLAAACTLAQNDEYILKAMKDEMQRSKGLRLPGLDAPYYTEYTISDADMVTISATWGALLGETHSPLRVQSVKVRVGDYNFDNGNYVYSEAFGGARYDSEELPLETNYLGLRQILWLATDRAFKTAEEGIARKRSALKNVNLPDSLPDFSKAQPVQALLPAPRKTVDEAAWKKRTVDLSAIFASYPVVQTSDVEFQSVQSVNYFVNSEGAEVRTPDNIGVPHQGPVASLRVGAGSRRGLGAGRRDPGSVGHKRAAAGCGVEAPGNSGGRNSDGARQSAAGIRLQRARAF